MSSESESAHSPEHQTHPEPQPKQIPVGAAQAWVPLENHREAVLSKEHENILCHNYEISPSVQLHFQDSATRTIKGGDITLFERMFMAGLRLPFPEIAQELVLFLMTTSIQIMPNAWRYLFASYILWKTVLGTRMSILQFLNIYRPKMGRSGTMELQVRQSPLFIFLKSAYSNNKQWKQQFFCVSGEWECSSS